VEENYFKGSDTLFPNESTYALLVDGYLRSPPNGLREATRILQHMHSLYEKTKDPAVLPSIQMYKDVMHHWSKTKAEDAMDRVDELFNQIAAVSPPTNAEFGALQAAWARSARPDAPSRVESILVRMQEEYETGRNLAARPTVENFGHVIQCWAASKQEGSAERADAVLQRLEDLCFANGGIYRNLQPTASCYESVLLGWLHSASPSAGERALAVLDRMKNVRSIAPSVSINQECYHHAILALATSMDASKAYNSYATLKDMQSNFESGQNRYARPTHDSYRSVLTVCSTCTRSSTEQDQAAEVAMKVMREYLSFAGTGARQDVYLQFLYCAFRLFPAGEARDDAVRTVFIENEYLQCPAAILDARTIRDALEKTVSPSVCNEIVAICSKGGSQVAHRTTSRATTLESSTQLQI
jgi:hypothetical protein